MSIAVVSVLPVRVPLGVNPDGASEFVVKGPAGENAATCVPVAGPPWSVTVGPVVPTGLLSLRWRLVRVWPWELVPVVNDRAAALEVAGSIESVAACTGLLTSAWGVMGGSAFVRPVTAATCGPSAKRRWCPRGSAGRS